MNDAVRLYTRVNKNFEQQMDQVKQQCKALGVTAAFGYLSGFMWIQTICYLEVCWFPHTHRQELESIVSQ